MNTTQVAVKPTAAADTATDVDGRARLRGARRRRRRRGGASR